MVASHRYFFGGKLNSIGSAFCIGANRNRITELSVAELPLTNPLVIDTPRPQPVPHSTLCPVAGDNSPGCHSCRTPANLLAAELGTHLPTSSRGRPWSHPHPFPHQSFTVRRLNWHNGTASTSIHDSIKKIQYPSLHLNPQETIGDDRVRSHNFTGTISGLPPPPGPLSPGAPPGEPPDRGRTPPPPTIPTWPRLALSTTLAQSLRDITPSPAAASDTPTFSLQLSVSIILVHCYAPT